MDVFEYVIFVLANVLIGADINNKKSIGISNFFPFSFHILHIFINLQPRQTIFFLHQYDPENGLDIHINRNHSQL